MSEQKEAKKPEEKKKASRTEAKEKIAIVRIRGNVRIMTKIENTMQMLKLYKRNFCVIVPKTESRIGMIKKIKDYVTWGEVSPETEKLLIEKRGEKDPKDEKKLKKFFRLHPPIKGFERKGIKATFNLGGALGYRGDKINDLIKRML